MTRTSRGYRVGAVRRRFHRYEGNFAVRPGVNISGGATVRVISGALAPSLQSAGVAGRARVDSATLHREDNPDGSYTLSLLCGRHTVSVNSTSLEVPNGASTVYLMLDIERNTDGGVSDVSASLGVAATLPAESADRFVTPLARLTSSAGGGLVIRQLQYGDVARFTAGGETTIEMEASSSGSESDPLNSESDPLNSESDPLNSGSDPLNSSSDSDPLNSGSGGGGGSTVSGGDAAYYVVNQYAMSSPGCTGSVQSLLLDHGILFGPLTLCSAVMEGDSLVYSLHTEIVGGPFATYSEAEASLYA
ncbi:MAG: hypothetical protein PHI35_09015 [Victivallaceae bacterium]|nr:hypothetical protein [Victivallaceae bacterium]